MNKSPFPGMDPYLEDSWRDVHQKLCVYSCDDIQAQLSGGLVARVEERLIVEQVEPSRARHVYGDVQVLERPARSTGAVAATVGVALAEPLILEVPAEKWNEGLIQIMDARGSGRVITVIEFLSPPNKLPGAGREQYRRKRRQLENAGVSLVEINLIRAGSFIDSLVETLMENQGRAPYYAIAHRGWMGEAYEYYPMPLEKRLPAIGIPLRESDPVAALDLQSLIERVYRNGAYDTEIDYAKEPAPPLEGDAWKWTMGVLKEAGLR